MDRRTRKTKRAIASAYLSLLQNKPINKISISEITELADIGRGTFYTHYSDIYDLHNQLLDDKLEALILLFDTTYPNDQITDFKTFCQNLVSFVSENQTIFQLLVKETRGRNDLRKIKEVLIAKVIAAESLDPNDLQSYIEVSFAKNQASLFKEIPDFYYSLILFPDSRTSRFLSDKSLTRF
jgi:AcrR family transcriptional regulator